jgi:hypothetical protein
MKTTGVVLISALFRKDDVGVPSKNLLGNDERSCPVFPLSSYSFTDVLKWDGNIVVQP